MQHSRLRGRDLHAPTNELVENQTGSPIPKLKVVALDGMGTSYPKVRVANAEIDVLFGLTYDEIPVGKCGTVAVFGFMMEVDTSAWPAGTILYSDIDGNLSTVPLNGIFAQVVKQDAEDGVLYIVTEPNTAAGSRSWRLIGNAGTNPTDNFFGTIDNQDVAVKTNSQLMATLSKEGRFGLGPDMSAPAAHFHQKSHTGFAGSGLKQETFSLVTNSNVGQVLYAVPIAQNSVVKIEINTIGRISDGSGRCGFKRSGLFFREASNVQAQRFWQTDFTEKSDTRFDISYALLVDQLVISVKSAVNTETYWTGHIKVEAVETSS